MESCVQVALRIRPQGNREKLEGSRVCTSVLPNEPQVTIGGDRSFTYDHVFDTPTQQHVVYESCVEKLVDGLFDGFNATVLAYGQTGSGKTHTMGTAFDAVVTQKDEDLGVIPRAIQHTFRKIAECKTSAIERGVLEPSFDVSVQFVELYNDDVLDLLSDDRSMSSSIRIHEDSRGEIVLHGVEQRSVFDMHGTMEILKNGALNRTVASTNMNEQSSRSHAIFTLHVKQQRVASSGGGGYSESAAGAELEMEMLAAKFHFVDLAGSERMKRTGATGDRAKEGISINVGLLALGNVIAALGGANGKVSHVPYRDSKLTRLLQDSLGGNSRTLMIACCSPSDSDFVETLNTMKYANRAKEIKNKVVANQDKSSKMIGELRARIAALEAELLEFKQGRRTVDVDGHEVVNDQYHENVYLTSEVNHLRFRVKALNETLDIMRAENIDLKAKQELQAILPGGSSSSESSDETDAVQQTFRKYLEELERTKSLLYESQSTCDQLRKDNARWKARGGGGGGESSATMLNSQRLIEMAKSEVEQQRRMVANAAGIHAPPQNNAPSSEYSSMGQDEEEVSEDVDEIDDVDDDEEDEEEEEESSASEALQIDLNEVMIELDIKEKLIDQLERAERQNQQIRETYEKKLRELMERIKETETERDRVLTEGTKKTSSGGGKMSDEQMRAIRQEYELKISDLRKELKKIEALDKEHLKVIAKSQRELLEKTRLKSEVVDLKKAKVELIKKMNEDKKKQKAQQLANARAIATKEKQTRLQANKIRTLEMKDKQREQFLKKTTQEVNALRKEKAAAAAAARQALRGGARASGPAVASPRRAPPRGPPKELAFSAKTTKVKWDAIVRKIEESTRRRQTVQKMEAELERYLNERHAAMLEIVENEKLFTQSQDVIYRDGLLEAIDSAKQKLQYVQDQITYQQKLICDVDEQETSGNGGDEEEAKTLKRQTIKQLFDGCETLSEARYLLQHLFDLCIDKATLAAKVEAEFKECAARIEQLEQQSNLKEQLLTSIIEDKSLVDEIEGIVPSDLRKSRTSSQNSLQRSASPTVFEDAHTLQNYKVRRHTATQDELLYANSETTSTRCESIDNSTPPQIDNNDVAASTGGGGGETDEKREKKKRIAFVSTSPPSTSSGFARNTRLRSTVAGGTVVRGGTQTPPPSQPTTTVTPNGNVAKSARKGLSSRLASVHEDREIATFATQSYPPMTSSARSRSSLTSSSSSLHHLGTTSSAGSTLSSGAKKQSRIVSIRDGMRGQIVTRTHILEGHARGVLSVDVADKLMVTGSKDRTAKLWDIEACREVRTLGVHPNNVHLVKFVPFSNYVFTFSMYEARAWDYRTPDCVCVKVLNSSGQVNEGESIDTSQVMPRQNTIPFLETVMTAADVDPTGHLLFTSFAAYVRVWNLREWKPLGRLNAASHSPKSEVSCLRTTMTADGAILAYTGSRDHYVKEYEVGLGTGVIESKCEFTPPHYDNVTAVLPLNGHLYTASKDVNIMKFSLKDGKREHLELRAHQQYIQSLAAFGPKGRELLVSACKDGTLRFWDVATSSRMRLVEEYSKAHQEGINDMCSPSNKSMLFTASADSTVGFWKSNIVDQL